MTVNATATVKLPTTNTFPDTCRMFVRDQFKNIAKLVNYAIAWTSIAKPDLSQNVIRFGGMAKDCKNFIGASELPWKLEKMAGAIKAFAQNPSTHTFRGALRDTSFAINSFFDGTELFTKYFPIAKERFELIQNVNYVATTCGSINGTVEELEKLSTDQAKTRPELARLYVINLAKNVSYLALGVMGVLGAFFGFKTVGWMMLASVTSGLLFTIGGYFYEKIVDPEKRHQNKDAIIINLTVENMGLRTA